MLSLWRRHSGHFGRCSFLYRPINKCLFSYGSQFSSGLEDHGISDVVEDDEINQNKPQLVCRKCTTPIINTENVILFKWKNGIHLASINDNPLKNLFPRTNCDQATHHSWKKYKLHCMRCDHGVGILANIRNRARSKNNNDDKILFSSKDCSIQMPPHQSPLLSSSGYPSSILSFRMWTELIAACETQPELKEALQIRRVCIFIYREKYHIDR
jgi:hypothetical protein